MNNTNQTIDKQQWEEYLALFPEANFLQSWNWGEFQQRLGKTVIRHCLLSSKGKVQGLFQSVVESAKRARYLAVAGGPLINWQDQTVMDECFMTLKATAQAQKCDFIRFRPQALDSPELQATAAKKGLQTAPMHLTADVTWQLSLLPTEAEILSQMRKQTRQAIRKAASLGITTTVSTQIEDIDDMYQSQLYLAKKHHFVPFSLRFWKEQFAAFLTDQQVCLIHAHNAEGQILATAFILFYHQEAVYHYGTSTELNKTLPGSYACQWAVIREAKRRGCTKYNFWGVAPAGQHHHRFAGVSTFKRGFGGEEVAYLPAHDLPLTKKYWFNYVVETMRRKTRHL